MNNHTSGILYFISFGLLFFSCQPGIQIVKENCGCLNVRSYGAIGDGKPHTIEKIYGDLDSARIVFPEIANILLLNDQVDWAAIQNSLLSVDAKNSKVCIPGGTYLTNRKIEIKSNTYLTGNGPSTIIKRVDNSDDIGHRSVFLSSGVSNITIEKFTIDFNGFKLIESDKKNKAFPNGIAFNGRCIKIDNNSNLCVEAIHNENITIQEIRIHDSKRTTNEFCCPHGILIRYGKNVIIDRNKLENGFRIKAGGVGNKIVITNNTIDGANDNAITIATADAGPDIITTRYLIKNNIISSTINGSAVFVGADGDTVVKLNTINVYSDIIISGNVITGPPENESIGVFVRATNYTKRIHIIGNLIKSIQLDPGDNNNNQGILIKGGRVSRNAKDILISNNVLSGFFKTSSIWVSAVENVRIVNNQISDNPGDAIRLGRSKNVLISSNIIDSCGIGIFLLAGKDSLPDSLMYVKVDNNIISKSINYGILIRTKQTGDVVDANFVGNKIHSSKNKIISEEKETHGEINTYYWINDIRDNETSSINFLINAELKGMGNKSG